VASGPRVASRVAGAVAALADLALRRLAGGAGAGPRRGGARAASEAKGRSSGLEPALAAETAAAFTIPAAICSTLITAAAAGVLAGSDLYLARELGLAVAAGLLIDLILLRVPFVAALARWGGAV
jgi:hypothetical protein